MNFSPFKLMLWLIITKEHERALLFSQYSFEKWGKGIRLLNKVTKTAKSKSFHFEGSFMFCLSTVFLSILATPRLICLGHIRSTSNYKWTNKDDNIHRRKALKSNNRTNAVSCLYIVKTKSRILTSRYKQNT